MFEDILNSKPKSNSTLQIECISELEKIFIKDNISQTVIDNYIFFGVRGNYIDKENYCLHFRFSYGEIQFEFFIMYDQFEFYIEKDEKVLAKCNLEDFNETTMIKDFTKYLKKDLKKLNIKFLDI